MLGKLENTGAVGSRQYPIKDVQLGLERSELKPVGNEFLEIINKQLDIIREKDERITELTNIILRQNAILEVNNSQIPNESNLEEPEKLGNARWNRVKSMLERKYSKSSPVNSEVKPDYITAAENAALELNPDA